MRIDGGAPDIAAGTAKANEILGTFGAISMKNMVLHLLKMG